MGSPRPSAEIKAEIEENVKKFNETVDAQDAKAREDLKAGKTHVSTTASLTVWSFSPFKNSAEKDAFLEKLLATVQQQPSETSAEENAQPAPPSLGLRK